MDWSQAVCLPDWKLKQAPEKFAEKIKKRRAKPKNKTRSRNEEYALLDDWKKVYDEFIRGKDNVIVKPDYDPENL